MIQLGDTFTFFSINLISQVGWANTYKLIGAYAAVFGVVCLTFVDEPSRDLPKMDTEDAQTEGDFEVVSE